MDKFIPQARFPLILGSAIILIIFFHVVKIGSLPMGLYLDETSIGLNAALIAETGRDEHGKSFPTYFKAFGENKNPIYIYAVAGVYKLTRVSEFGLRFTSFLFFFIGFVFFLLFVDKLWPKNRRILLFATLAFGFLPQFFVLSRMSFEVVSQLSWLVASFYLMWLCFEGRIASSKQRWLIALLCGVVLGTSIYTYSIARLLTMLTCISFGLIYLSKENFKYLVVIGLSVIVCLIPFLIFIQENPGGMTARFFMLSYLDDPIPWYIKLLKFSHYYLEYWAPRFLLFRGDLNFRHAIGFAGMVYVIVWLLAILGVAHLLFSGLWKKRFNLLLLLNMLFAPLAASLTEESVPHALRALPLGFYIVIMACFGFQWLMSISDSNAVRRFQQVVWALLVFEVASYLFMYFVFFPERSIHGSQSYDTRGTLQAAYDRKPKRVIFYQQPRGTYANLRFYDFLVDNPDNIPLIVSNNTKPEEGDCLIYYHWYEGRTNRYRGHKYREAKRYQPPWLARQLGVPAKDHIARMKCY